jgi:hypothetical protein
MTRALAHPSWFATPMSVAARRATSRIPSQPIKATALTVLGAMREATLYVALAEDHDQARQEAGIVMNRLIHALSAE